MKDTPSLVNDANLIKTLQAIAAELGLKPLMLEEPQQSSVMTVGKVTSGGAVTGLHLGSVIGESIQKSLGAGKSVEQTAKDVVEQNPEITLDDLLMASISTIATHLGIEPLLAGTEQPPVNITLDDKVVPLIVGNALDKEIHQFIKEGHSVQKVAELIVANWTGLANDILLLTAIDTIAEHIGVTPPLVEEAKLPGGVLVGQITLGTGLFDLKTGSKVADIFEVGLKQGKSIQQMAKEVEKELPSTKLKIDGHLLDTIKNIADKLGIEPLLAGTETEIDPHTALHSPWAYSELPSDQHGQLYANIPDEVALCFGQKAGVSFKVYAVKLDFFTDTPIKLTVNQVKQAWADCVAEYEAWQEKPMSFGDLVKAGQEVTKAEIKELVKQGKGSLTEIAAGTGLALDASLTDVIHSIKAEVAEEKPEAEPDVASLLKQTQTTMQAAYKKISAVDFGKAIETKEYKKLPQSVKDWMHKAMSHHILLAEGEGVSDETLLESLQALFIVTNKFPISPLMVKLQLNIEKQAGDILTAAGKLEPTAQAQKEEAEELEPGPPEKQVTYKGKIVPFSLGSVIDQNIKSLLQEGHAIHTTAKLVVAKDPDLINDALLISAIQGIAGE